MKAIRNETLNQWDEKIAHCSRRQLAARALSRCEISDIAYNASEGNTLRHHFSLEIKTLPVTNQERSGRCWLFAAANVLREKIAKELNLEQFELSQSYLAFWDKFERANYFLDSIVKTANLPADDRTVSFILKTGVHDGGQWDMFANIVRKYGIVPKEVFDETYQSCHTNLMNHYLNRNLKICAVKLRAMVREGASGEEIEKAAEGMLEKIYSFLCTCYGQPPKEFDFVYNDRDRGYHIEKGFTPQSFCRKYIGNYLEEVVSIINAPTADKPFEKTYTIRFLGNVLEGKKVIHLNLSMEDFKQAILRQMQDGKVVWFGSDVGKWGDRNKGFWDDRAFDAELVTGLDLEISKADALDHQFSAMNHAMVLTGVELEDGKPVRWKIENSWGDEHGKKGYYICSDSWFDQYVYQATVEKQYLGAQAKLAEQEPIELDPWDPMGTLAD